MVAAKLKYNNVLLNTVQMINSYMYMYMYVLPNGKLIRWKLLSKEKVYKYSRKFKFFYSTFASLFFDAIVVNI